MSAATRRASNVVPGHGLVAEGAAHDEHGRRISGGTGGTGRAHCSCGERSPVLSSVTKRQTWHKTHKGELAARPAERGAS